MKKVFIWTLPFVVIAYTMDVNAQCPGSPGGGCDLNSNLSLYWIGTDASNNGNWNDPCSWRVGSVLGVEPCQAPRSTDSVFFNAAGFAGAAGNATITINGASKCKNISIDADVSTLANAPTFDLKDPGYLETYGSFVLQPNVVWTTENNESGPEVFFRSANVGNVIQTAGHALGSIVWNGIGGEWALQDSLYAGDVNLLFGHLTTSDGVTDFPMNVHTFSALYQSGATTSNKILDLNSSTFWVRGGFNRYNTIWSENSWETTKGDTTNFQLNPGNSRIVFLSNGGRAFCHLGRLNYNIIEHASVSNYFYPHTSTYMPAIIDSLILDNYIYSWSTLDVNHFIINSSGKTHTLNRGMTVNNKFHPSGTSCVPIKFKSETTRIINFPASHDTLRNVSMENLSASVSGGGNQPMIGYTSGSVTGWDVILPASRTLYWVGDTSNNWSNPVNWSTSSSGTPLLAASDCPPTQVDDVYFISPLVDGDTVDVDVVATCRHMTWNITSVATFSGNKRMSFYGSLIFDADMTYSNTSVFDLYGSGPDSILSAGNTLQYLQFRGGSDYFLSDNLTLNSDFYFWQNCNFDANEKNISAVRMNFRGGTMDFSGSTITLSYWKPWELKGTQAGVIYDANSHVIFSNTSAITLLMSGWGTNMKLPKFTLLDPCTQMKISTALYTGSTITFEGDVTLNGSATLYNDYLTSVNSPDPHAPDKIIIQGNLNLSPGKTYELSAVDTVVVEGDINGTASCSQPITMKGYNSLDYNLRIDGGMLAAHTIISDANAAGAYTATDCHDGGNNSNWTIVPPVGGGKKTYYWRADVGSCSGTCDYDGNWEDPNHWTTNQSSNEGDGTCIPSTFDKVVFDNSSWNGSTNAIVSMPACAKAVCDTLTAQNSGIVLSGSTALNVSGSLLNDGTLYFTSMTGEVLFNSIRTATETVDMSGRKFFGNVVFSSSIGSWSLADSLSTNSILELSIGTLTTNDYLVRAQYLLSDGSSNRILNLGNSDVFIYGNGNYVSSGNVQNVYTIDFYGATNLTVNPGNSHVYITGSNEPVACIASASFNDITFTDATVTLSTSPVIEADSAFLGYVNFMGSGRIYGTNTFDTLKFNPGNSYKFQSGKTQYFSAPDGLFISDGSPGSQITVSSTVSGSDAMLHKDNTGGQLTHFCFDYISVEDNVASSNDPIFNFFTKSNSDNVNGSATGIWDFTRTTFITPSITAEPDINLCKGSTTDIVFTLGGSGPYSVIYKTNGVVTDTVDLPNSATEFRLVDQQIDTTTTYTVSYFVGDDCNTLTPGTFVDSVVVVNVPSVGPLSQDEDSSSCFLNNDTTWIHFYSDNVGSDRPLLSLYDELAGSGLGTVLSTVRVETTTQFHNGRPYLRRHFGVTPTNNEAARVRLYFTQEELDSLSLYYPPPAITVNDIQVTKYDNDNLDFTGSASLMSITSRGTIPSGITNTGDVYFVEFNVTSFSHLLLHVGIAPLPVQLTYFRAEEMEDVAVHLTWETETELNNNFFKILRSTDLINWENIAIVPSKAVGGNSTTTLDYELYDVDPHYGASFYRLQQVDFNGDSAYSQIEDVFFQGLEIINIYPNPSVDFIEFIVNSHVYASMEILIYDSKGRIVIKEVHDIEVGFIKFNIDVSKLSDGIYLLKVQTGDGKYYDSKHFVTKSR